MEQGILQCLFVIPFWHFLSGKATPFNGQILQKADFNTDTAEAWGLMKGLNIEDARKAVNGKIHEWVIFLTQFYCRTTVFSRL